LVEPLADAEVNVPGVMAMLAASVVVQLRALLAPEFMPVGFAAKELIVGIGCEPFPVPEVDNPQPASPMQMSRTRARDGFFRRSACRRGIQEFLTEL